MSVDGDGSTPRPVTAGHAAVTFLLSAVFVVLAVGMVQLAAHLLPGTASPLFTSVITVALLFGGLLTLGAIRMPQLRPWSAVGLVRRPSAGNEFGLGAAVGWAAAILLVLPSVLTLHMHAVLLLDGFHTGATVASTLLLLLLVLGRQLVLCGLPFRSLCQATSPLFASIAISGIAALLIVTADHGDAGEAFIAAIVQLVLCTAAARTRAIWLGIGLQMLWAWTVTILFGLPSFLWPSATSIVQGYVTGSRWAMGDRLGPEASVWAIFVSLGMLVAVWRLTRDYAWHYTFDPIVGGGYAMDVAPPAEHSRMEQQAANRPAPLVQIGGLAAQAPQEEVPHDSSSY